VYAGYDTTDLGENFCKRAEKYENYEIAEDGSK